MGCGKTMALQVTALLIMVVSALASDAVTIQQLQTNPELFHNHLVTLHGSVHQIQFLTADSEGSSLKPLEGTPPLELPCWVRRPAYTFVLADDTGFQQILVMPLVAYDRGTVPCIAARGLAPPPDVGEGDRIALEARIRVVRQQQGVREVRTLEVYAVSIERPNR